MWAEPTQVRIQPLAIFFIKVEHCIRGGEEFKRRKLTKIGQGEENIKQRGREPWSSGYGRRFMFQRS